MALNLKAILGLDGSGFEAGMKRAQSTAQKFATSAQSGISRKLGGFLTAAFVEESIRKTVNYGGAINDLSERLGVSTDAIQQWEYAAKQAGGTADNVAMFFEKISENRDKALNGDAGALKSFKDFGVTPDDLKNKRVEDIGLQIGNAVKAGDAQALIGSLKEIGGKGAAALVASMKGGLEEAFGNAPLIKTEDIVRLDALGDEFVTLGKRIMAALTPAITAIAEKFFELTDHIKGVGAYFGSRSGGASVKESYKAMFDAENDSKKDREKSIAGAMAAAMDRGKGVSYVSKDKKPDKSFVLDQKNPLASSSINSLQQIGARVGFNPMAVAIEKNTIALNKASDAFSKTYTGTHKDYQNRNRWVEGMDGGSNDMGVRY